MGINRILAMRNKMIRFRRRTLSIITFQRSKVRDLSSKQSKRSHLIRMKMTILLLHQKEKMWVKRNNLLVGMSVVCRRQLRNQRIYVIRLTNKSFLSRVPQSARLSSRIRNQEFPSNSSSNSLQEVQLHLRVLNSDSSCKWQGRKGRHKQHLF